MRHEGLHTETRPGHTWGFDLLVWKSESVQGNKYSLIMRDYKTGYFIVRHMRNKSDLTNVMDKVINDTRSDPRFKLEPDRSEFMDVECLDASIR